MFNGDLKKEALADLQRASDKNEAATEEVMGASTKLYDLRSICCVDLISKVENYINTLANSPKELDKSFSEYQTETTSFNESVSKLELEAQKSSTTAAGGAAAGVAAGVGTAALAPTAAMAIATTFGTASTGTAISALSGAAATNAALAWIGGGALTAGGGGMVAGKGLLALAGPVGWAIGGVALAGAGMYSRKKNKEIAEKANSERREIEANIRTLDLMLKSTTELYTLTKEHSDGVYDVLISLKATAPNDYKSFTTKHKEMLGALVNHIHSLSKVINKQVDIG
ncbi:hypothetical protein LRP52_28930 [Photobacterium sp. ZSDE20]|uniref:Glycine zipper family protein n=1 Tax=Photobacterium pectinilyticum TaxID=2906793 RepID=A0ABT1N6S9_9GAMM|nr:hypothetical protein [Photobacterium sp. ZSDE20]MCQ1060456.1 hypothetical protein [Photobacterium sp. ZSDE20]MDD1826206.1 hypothetical protein [Photobacterium sp. ZSDE20]